MERREKCGTSIMGMEDGLLGMFTVQPMNTPAFITKLYKMVDDSIEDCIIWSSKGDHFIVISPNNFSKTVLPRYFKHSNWTSFVRQLNMYGFHKVNEYRDQMDQDIWSFKHNFFYRGGKHTLHLIRRKRVSNASNDSSSTSMTKNTPLPEIEEDGNSSESQSPTEPISIEIQSKLQRIEAAMSNTQNQFNMMETELSKLRYIFQEQQKLSLLVMETLNKAGLDKNNNINSMTDGKKDEEVDDGEEKVVVRNDKKPENTVEHDRVVITAGINVTANSSGAVAKDTNNPVTNTIATATTTTMTNTSNTTTSTHQCNNILYDPVWDCMRCGCSQQRQRNSTAELKQKGASSFFFQQAKYKSPSSP
ncbi:hypothetical protein INT45_003431 [Circinella minor]|uniref:HSF-type DNA-binding domain-containing protein n=1 Tax=Circinella minor TaxID=1195481 RepID=A0A8H7RVP6_9FUNG|nr:hypothetical protein INT45_003431 [Circinella minor]